MASDNSFDVVSQLDMQEVRNAVDQAMREIGQRFDFKGSISRITLEDDALLLVADDAGKLKSVARVLEERLVKRSIALKALDYQEAEAASAGAARQRVGLKNGVPTDTARQIVKSIKQLKLKVQAAIQGDQVRVSGKKRDDLQQVMTHLKKQDFDLPLQFINFR